MTAETEKIDWISRGIVGLLCLLPWIPFLAGARAPERSAGEEEKADARPDIQKELRSPYLQAREKALDSLVRRGPASLPVLIQLLNDPDHRVRTLAARGLERVRHPRGRNALLERLGTEKDPRLIDCIARALVPYGREARGVLKSRSRSPTATPTDIRAYDRFFWEYVISLIRRILRENTHASGDFKGFYDGMFKDVAVLGPEAGNVLMRMILDRERFSLNIRQFAIRAMAEVGNKRFIPALLKYYNQLISKLGPDDPVPFAPSVEDHERIVLTYARFVLARMGETGPMRDQIRHYQGRMMRLRGRQDEYAGEYQYAIAYEWHQARDFNRALEAYQEYIDSYPKEKLKYIDNRHMAFYNMCCIESRRNRIDRALHFLRKSFEENYTDFAWLDLDTDLDNIRNTPGFKKLVEAQRAKFIPKSN